MFDIAEPFGGRPYRTTLYQPNTHHLSTLAGRIAYLKLGSTRVPGIMVVCWAAFGDTAPPRIVPRDAQYRSTRARNISIA
jgi:hypothetical protein